ncbi:hypothetical protein NC652_012376 [Populus alba x Populus x berolinensis]|nr:hypothetical protein NC652_012376 [Populus alba x Populus x berolinensis]
MGIDVASNVHGEFTCITLNPSSAMSCMAFEKSTNGERSMSLALADLALGTYCGCLSNAEVCPFHILIIHISLNELIVNWMYCNMAALGAKYQWHGNY